MSQVTDYSLYKELGDVIGKVDKEYQQEFKKYVSDDLDTPRALVVLWDVLKNKNLNDADKKATVLDFDKVLGLGFENIKEYIQNVHLYS